MLWFDFVDILYLFVGMGIGGLIVTVVDAMEDKSDE